MGSRGVGDAEHPTKLEPLGLAYRELAAVLPSRAELQALGEAARTVLQAMEEFR